MVLCGICNIFRKNNPREHKFIKINKSYSLYIILHELNQKVKDAEEIYSKDPSGENLLKCINAINMQKKFLQNNNISQTLNVIVEDDENLC